MLFNNDKFDEYDVFFNGIINDIKSNKPYSQKKYLQKFDKMCQDKTIHYNNNNIHSSNYHQNYYGSNNIQIIGECAETGLVCGFF